MALSNEERRAGLEGIRRTLEELERARTENPPAIDPATIFAPFAYPEDGRLPLTDEGPPPPAGSALPSDDVNPEPEVGEC